MAIREYRKLTDKDRMFMALYGGRDLTATRGVKPIPFLAAHFAGINTMGKDEFIRVMNGAGKQLLRMGIDCRTDAERIRHQLHQIQTGQVAPGEKPI